MVDFRSTPYSSTRTYSSSGSTRTSGSSSYSRNKKRQEAFSRPALGQAVPGALTAAEPGSYTGSVAFAPTPSRYPLVQRGGQTVALGASPSTQKVPELGMSEAFAAKAAQLGTMQESPLNLGNVTEDPRLQVFRDFAATQPAAGQFSVPVEGTFQGTGQHFAENTEGGLAGFIKAQIQDQLGLMQADPSRVAAAQVVTPLLSLGLTSMSTGQLSTLMRGTRAGDLLKVGTIGVDAKATTTAGKMAVNGATAKTTASWLGKFVRNPNVLIAAIGSYPFAGFIKEEALQTTGFATRTALENGDIEGAERAIALQDEILNPDVVNQIIGAVPFANVLNNLKDYFDAARLQSSVYKNVIEIRKEAEVSGVAPAQIAAEKEKNDYRANVDYYNEQRKQMLEWELEARAIAASSNREGEVAAARRQADYWFKKKAELLKLEEEQQRKIMEFWLEYKKLVAELESQATSFSSGGGGGFSRSTLGFGLLR